MFSFEIFITILFSIFIFYISQYIPLKSSKNALRTKYIQSESKHEKTVLKGEEFQTEMLMAFLQCITFILIFIASFLYFTPNLTLSQSPVLFWNFIKKLFPFGMAEFTNSHFKFSYIIESIFLTLYILFKILGYLVSSMVENEEFPIIELIKLIPIIWILIWVNYFISSFLSNNLTYLFKFISLIINIIIYSIIVYFSDYF